MRKTSYLKNILKGIAVVFGFSSMLSSSVKYEVQGDSESLASDWKAVESDMKVAFNDFRNKYC